MNDLEESEAILPARPLELRALGANLLVLTLALLQPVRVEAAALVCPGPTTNGTTRLITSDKDFTWFPNQTWTNDLVLGPVLSVDNSVNFATIEGSSATSVIVTNLNDMVELSFRFKWINPGTANEFRFGLFDNKGTPNNSADDDGYSVRITAAGGLATADVFRELGGAPDPLLTRTNSLVGIVTRSQLLVADTNWHTASLILARTAPGALNMSVKVDETLIASGLDLSPVSTSFSAVAFGIGTSLVPLDYEINALQLRAVTGCQVPLPDLRGGVGGAGACGIFQDPAPGTLVGVGTNTVRFSVDATCQNIEPCSTSFIVVDDTPPLIATYPGDIFNQCGGVVNWPVPTVKDNCSGATIAQSAGPPNGSLFPPGVTKVVYTAKDGAGNTNQCTFTVTVSADVQPPVLSGLPPPTDSYQCLSQVPAPPTVTAFDNCNGQVTVDYSQDPPNPVAQCSLTVKRTWTAVDSAGNRRTPYVQTISINDTGPIFRSQPTGRPLCPGEPLALSAVADGCGVSYQWRKNSANLPGETGQSLTVSNPSAGDVYDVVATSSCGRTTPSSQVPVTFTAPVTIQSAPRDQSVCEDPSSSVTFRVTVTGTGPFTFDWSKDLVPLSQGSEFNIGSDQQAGVSTLTVLHSTGTYQGLYTVRVSGACGLFDTGTARLSVNSGVSTTSFPGNIDLCTGGTAVFTTVTTGTPPFKYSWTKDGAPVTLTERVTITSVGSGSIVTNTLTIASLNLLDHGNYAVTVSGPCGTDTQSRGVNVHLAPVMSLTAPSPPVCDGSTMMFFAVADTSEPIPDTIFWTRDGKPLTDGVGNVTIDRLQRTSRLTLTDLTAADSGVYTVTATGTCPSTATTNITVIVPKVSALPLQQPAPVCQGGSVTFTTFAGGSTNYSFQWFHGNKEILDDGKKYFVTYSASGDTSTLTIKDVRSADTGPYTASVGSAFDFCRAVTTAVNVSLTTSVASGGTAQAASSSICSGTDTTISWVGQGGAIATWQSSPDSINWTDLGTASNPLTTGKLLQTTYYQAVLQSGDCGIVTSSAAKVTVGQSVAGGTAVAASPGVCPTTGTTISLSGQTGTIAKWQSSLDGNNWADIPSTAPQLTTGNLTQTTQYRAVMQNGGCSASDITSTVATVTVSQAGAGGTAVAESASVCSGTGTAITLSDQVGSIVRWESSVDQVSWRDLGSTSNRLSTGPLTQTTYFRALLLSACSSGPSSVATVTIGQTTVAGTALAQSAKVCSGTGTTISLSGQGTIAKWQSSPDGNNWNDLPSTANPLSTGNLTQTTSYRAQVLNGSCSSGPSTVATVTVSELSVGGTAMADLATLCSGSGTAIGLTGQTGAIAKWQSSVDGNNWIDLSSSSNRLSTGILTQTTQYRAFVQNGGCSPATSTVATVTVGQASVGGTAQANPASVCPGTGTSVALTGQVGTIARWQKTTDGNNWIDLSTASNPLITESLNQTTSYRAVVQNGGCSPINSSVAIVTVGQTSAVGGTALADSASVCPGGSTTIKLVGQVGTIDRWQWSLDSFNWNDLPYASNPLLTGNLTQTIQYRALIQNGTCSSSSAVSSVAKVTVNQTSVGGTAQPASPSVCPGTGTTISLAGQIGAIARWQSSVDGVNWSDLPFPFSPLNTGILTQTTQFRAVVQNGGCSEATSSAALVTVSQTSMGGTALADSATVCSGGGTSIHLAGQVGTIVRWQSSVDGIFWNNLSVASNPLSTGSLTQTTQFRAQVQNGGCSPATSTVAVVGLGQTSVGGTASADSANVCPGTSTTITLSDQVGSIANWQWSSDGSSWNDLPYTSNPLLTGNLTQTIHYRAVVQNGGCSPANSSMATVTVAQTSAGGTALADSPSVCPGTGTTVTLAGQVGAIQKWQWSSDAVNWNDLASNANPLSTGNLTQPVQYRAVVQNGLCGASTSSVATVTVGQTSTGGAAVADSDSVCSGSGTTILLTGQVGSIQKWQWSVDGINWIDLASNANPLSTGNLTQTTQYRAVVQNGTCSPVISTVAVVALQPTSVGGTPLADSASVCSGTGTAITLNGHVGTILKWQSSTDGSNWNDLASTSNSLNTGNLTQPTQFRAVVQSGNCPVAISGAARLSVKTFVASITPSGSTTLCGGASLDLTANPSGATYLWNTGEITPRIRVNAAGIYTVTVTDTNGCHVIQSITIENPPQLTLSLSAVDASCVGVKDGSVVAQIAGGTPPYLAAIDGGFFDTRPSPFTFSSIGSGVHTVTVRDANGCVQVASETVGTTGAPPVISGQPASSAVCQGESATFKVAASGSAPLQYQWRKNGVGIPGALSGVYTVTNSTSADAGTYDVVVSNGNCGTLSSAPATLLVNSPPTVSVNAVTTCPGAPVDLKATHNAGPDATFLWTPGGQTTASISVAPTTNAVFRVRVTNRAGCSTEATALVTVQDQSPPTILNYPTVKSLTADSCQIALPDLTGEYVVADDCTAKADLILTQSPAPGTLLGVGDTLVTVTVQDRGGNKTTGQTKVTVAEVLPTITISDASVTEGDAGTTNATFTVGLSKSPCARVTVNYITVDGGGTGGGGQTVLDPKIVFSANQAIISWPTSLQGFQLQSKQTLGPGGWVPVAQQPTVSGSNFIVIQPLTGNSTFFQLWKAGATGGTNGTGQAGIDYLATSGSLTFDPGITIQTITVQVAGNKIKQLDRTFVVHLSNPTHATLNKPDGVGTIHDNDAAPVLSISDVSVAEGNSGTTPALFTVSLAGPTELGVTVSYATADGTGKAGIDYQAITGSLTFSPGEASKTVAVQVIGNTLKQGDRTFLVNLSAPVQAAITDGQGVGTIVDDDAVPVLTINDVNVAEGNSGTSPALFTVSLAGATQLPVTVNYATADGTAKAGSDYSATSGSLSFGPGETTKTISVLVNGDTVYEPDETFFVKLSGAVGATIGKAQGLGTILDEDAEPVLSISDVNVAEGNSGTTPAVFTVSLTGATQLAVTVNYSTADGTAKAGSDYSATSGTLSFAPGETSKTISVLVNGDTVYEPDETFFVKLSGVVGATIGKARGLGTILDEDVQPVLSISDVSVAEGNSGTTPAVFTVSLTGATQLAVTVNYSTADGTAKAGTDYQSATGSLTFSPGESSKTVTVQVIGNTLKQSDRTFLVNLSASVGATIQKAQGVGTIVDDDVSPVLSITDVNVAEGDSGTTPAVFTVSLSGTTQLPVTVNFATADGTAKAGSDYSATTGTLTFAPGETAKTISVLVNGDTIYEPDETFFVNLSVAGNATIGKARGVGTILDEEAPPALNISDVTVTEGNSGTVPAVFTVSLAGATQLAVTVNYATADGTGKAGTDYQSTAGSLTFNPGESSKTVTVQVIGNTLKQSDRTFLVNLSSPVQATIKKGQGTGTIHDDDAVPVLSINDVTVIEGNSGTTPAVFTVSLSAASSQPVSVDFATADGTATAPSDYVSTRGTLRFDPAGDSGNTNTPPGGVSASDVTLSRAGNQTTVSWPASLQGYELQVADDVAGPWRVVPIAPVAVGDTLVVTIESSGAQWEFYRLMPVGSGVATVAAVVFGPGETSKTITVLVNGDTVFEPDETFFVDLSNPVNATMSKARGVGTIRDDDHANQPPTVRILSPENDAVFLVGSDVVIDTDAADKDGSIARVDFYAGTTLVGSATQAPYTVTWSRVSSVGNYSLTAKATDNQGATTVSSPILIQVANLAADVAIVRNFADPEITVIQDYLFELGLTYYVFDQANLTFDVLRDFKLVIWDDLGQPGLQGKTVDVFQQAYNAGIPLYLIGERLASVTSSLNEPSRSAWTRLTHFQPTTSTQGGNGAVSIITAGSHRVINGRFGFIADFDYPAKLDQTTENNTGEVLLGQSGNTDVLLAYEDPGTGLRTVTQNLLVANSSNSDDSISERKRLFQNAVWWLLRKPLCDLTDVAISQTASANPVKTGDPLTYTLTVQRSGECEGTGVTVTDVLPAGVTFVSADSPQGTWSQAAGVVTFHLGLLEEVFLQLSVTVTPTQPGQITNAVRIRTNEREQNLANNASSLVTQVQAGQ